MSRQVKLFIYGIIFLYSIASNIEVDDSNDSKIPVVSNPPSSSVVGDSSNNNSKNSNTEYDLDSNSVINYPRPINGFSPYNTFFGQPIYDRNSENKIIIKNSNSSDAVVVLVDAYSGKKIRNEYIRKGDNFSMTGVPNGTYYLEWVSGNDWSPNLMVGKLKGGFQTSQSFTKTRDKNDWMNLTGYIEYTITLYTVSGGNVESESLSANEFGN